jgi:hypothetical protein
MLPEKFALKIDGWSQGATHYLDIAAQYKEGDEIVERLLSISPSTILGADDDDDNIAPVIKDIVLESDSFDATTHAVHIQTVLSTYYGQEQKQDYVCITGDNTNLNPAVANELGIPFVGCSNHQLNLEMKKLCKDQPMIQRVIKTLHKIMVTTTEKAAFAVWLRNVFEEIGELNKTPKFQCETRLTGSFVMVDYYMNESKHLKNIGVDQSWFPFKDNVAAAEVGAAAAAAEEAGLDDVASDDESNDLGTSKCTEDKVNQVFQLFVKLHLLTLSMQAIVCGCAANQSTCVYQSLFILKHWIAHH